MAAALRLGEWFDWMKAEGVYDNTRIIIVADHGCDNGDFEEMKCTKMDTDGIVEQLRQTDGVEVSLFAYQLSDKKFKYSLRAKAKVDVNKVATTFGGGGHVKAAGFESEKPYEVVLATVAELVKAQLDG
jgi:phosphoesterase RecJ-like protein